MSSPRPKRPGGGRRRGAPVLLPQDPPSSDRTRGLAPSDSTFHVLLEVAVDRFSADFGFLYLLEGNALALAAACAWDRGKVDPPCETLPATGWTLALHHASSDSTSLPRAFGRAARRSGLESWWILPLEGERGLRGLLLLAWEACVEVDPGDWDRAEAMTESFGLVLERLRQRLRRDARAEDR